MDDEETRLQTDLAVEGREMFETSFALSENLYLLIQPLEFYSRHVGDTLALPGCPAITVDTDQRSVNLNFNAATQCPNSPLNRSGVISLFYSNSQINNDELVLVEYTGYTVRKSTIEGNRLITKRAGTIESSLIKDTMASLMVYDEFGSSTRVNADFDHQVVILQDTLTQISTTGTGGGRNLAGRAFSMEITSPKIYQIRCFSEGVFLANRGVERWTIERTVSPAVSHSVDFGEGNECDTNASVRLSNGEVIAFSQ